MATISSQNKQPFCAGNKQPRFGWKYCTLVGKTMWDLWRTKWYWGRFPPTTYHSSRIQPHPTSPIRLPNTQQVGTNVDKDVRLKLSTGFYTILTELLRGFPHSNHATAGKVPKSVQACSSHIPSKYHSLSNCTFYCSN